VTSGGLFKLSSDATQGETHALDKNSRTEPEFQQRSGPGKKHPREKNNSKISEKQMCHLVLRLPKQLAAPKFMS
jgi:hypothetical protein